MQRCHPGPWLRPGDPNASGDGVEGGTFESWLTLIESLLDINTVTRAQLLVVPGFGIRTVRRILEARPFADMADFRARVRLNNRDWNRAKDKITVGGLT